MSRLARTVTSNGTRPAFVLAIAAAAALCLAPSGPRVHAQQQVGVTVRADMPGSHIDPMFYGLMTEEINFSYDGGLYAELIRNRTFRDDATAPAHWAVVNTDPPGAGQVRGTIALVQDPVPATALTTALELNATSASSAQPVSVANEGYWGIPVKPDTTYRVSFWARSVDSFSGTITASIASNDGKNVWASRAVGRPTGTWKKFETTLKTGRLTASTTNRFLLSTTAPGKVRFSLVSLFPPTYKNRSNGNRARPACPSTPST